MRFDSPALEYEMGSGIYIYIYICFLFFGIDYALSGNETVDAICAGLPIAEVQFLLRRNGFIKW